MKYSQVLKGTFAAVVFSVSAHSLQAQKSAGTTDFDQLAKRAATAFSKTTSLAFTLTAKSVSPGFSLAAVTGGEGTILFPDRMVFKGTLQSSPAMAAPFVVAGCGTEQFVEMGDGNFMKMEAAPNIGKVLFSSDTSFVLGILKTLEQVTAPKSVKLNNVDTWNVSGVVPASLLKTLPSRRSPAAGDVKAELWLSQKDAKLHQLVLTGPLLDTDTQQTIRTLTLSKFNESATLSVPRGKLPCSAAAAEK